MKKSYMLKFDRVQGDYVIIEEEYKEDCIQEEKRGMFFGKGLFKNFKKTTNNQEKTQKTEEKSGFLSCLDEKLEGKRQEEVELSRGLSGINLSSKNIVVEGKQGGENPPAQSPEAPTPTPAPPATPVQPTPSQTPQTPSNNISVGEGVQLLAELYNNFRILNMIYQNLRDVNQVSSATFSDFISENVALQGGLLNIYYAVSGQNLPPVLDETVPVLSSRFDEIVDVAAAFVKGMRDINLRLSKIFAVDRFNRQFNLIENALSIQNDYLTGLRIQALSNKF